MFQKSLKRSPRLKGPNALWRKLHYPLISMHLKCNDWRRFGAKNGSKSNRIAKLWQFSLRHPKEAFSEKVQRVDQGKLLKNRLKTSPRLEGSKALWRKQHYPLITMHLKCKDWKRFWRNKRLQKGLNGQVIGIFPRSPKTCIFSKSAKGKPKEIFQKSPKKQPSLERLNRTLAQMALSSNLYALNVQRLEKILVQKAAHKMPEWPGYCNFRKINQNLHFLKKCEEGTKRNFSKIPKNVALV